MGTCVCIVYISVLSASQIYYCCTVDIRCVQCWGYSYWTNLCVLSPLGMEVQNSMCQDFCSAEPHIIGPCLLFLIDLVRKHIQINGLQMFGFVPCGLIKYINSQLPDGSNSWSSHHSPRPDSDHSCNGQSINSTYASSYMALRAQSLALYPTHPIHFARAQKKLESL